jgi:hypothetical protein
MSEISPPALVFITSMYICCDSKSKPHQTYKIYINVAFECDLLNYKVSFKS